MDLSNKPLMRVLCAEPLEGRWLLSAATGDASNEAAVGQTATVTLGEREKVGEDEEDEDVVVSPAALPANVLAAFDARYENAEITQAELEHDDERGAEYGITAEHAGREVDVTISLTGEIVETETSIELAEVPRDVVDKIRLDFQGSVITEAADLGDGTTYELLFTDADGVEWEIEASRTLTTAPPTTPPPTTTPPPLTPPLGEPPPEAPPAVAAAAPAAPPRDAALLPARAAVVPPEVAAAQAPPDADSVPPSAVTADAERRQREDAIERAAAAKAEGTAMLSANRIAEALDALAAGAGASVWLPEVAGAMIDALPFNVDAIERGVQDVLRQISGVGGATKSKAADAPLATGASRLAVGVTLVAAIKMLLNQSKKPASTGGALVFGPANASWGWVLGTGAARRRRVASRQRET